MPKFFLLFFAIVSFVVALSTSCANIIPPGGGPIDSLPPVLITATPKDSATNVSNNRITLYFNEYVEIQNAQENIVVSPLPTNNPIIDNKLRTVNIRLRDTLEPNTTYSINFGNAIKDINEGNVLKNFVYVFSTGNTIDSNSLTGKVILAENGRVDSTLVVVLHTSLEDSAVAKEKPRYLAKLDGQGNFIFQNLPAGTFALYAIANDYNRRYDDSTELFAFANAPVNLSEPTDPIILYAYNYPKPPPRSNIPASTKGMTNVSTQSNALRYTTSLEAGGKHDLLKPAVELFFNRGIFSFDSTSVVFTNENYDALPGYHFTADTNRTKFSLVYPWVEGKEYRLLIKKEAFQDSAGVTLLHNDTLKISTKEKEDYGGVKVRFANLDLSKNPVLQLVQNEKVVEAIPLTQREWNRKLFPPGEYDMRILYDSNKNGLWDPGNFFGEKRQPEIVRDLKIKLSIRANWDNEKDISL